jgi:hypothetical protein
MGIVWDSYGGMEMAARETQASVGFVVETKETGRDMHLVALGCHALLKSASHSFANFNSLDRCFIVENLRRPWARRCTYRTTSTLPKRAHHA